LTSGQPTTTTNQDAHPGGIQKATDETP